MCYSRIYSFCEGILFSFYFLLNLISFAFFSNINSFKFFFSSLILSAYFGPLYIIKAFLFLWKICPKYKLWIAFLAFLNYKFYNSFIFASLDLVSFIMQAKNNKYFITLDYIFLILKSLILLFEILFKLSCFYCYY